MNIGADYHVLTDRYIGEKITNGYKVSNMGKVILYDNHLGMVVTVSRQCA